MRNSGIPKVLPAILWAFAIFCLPPALAKPLFFRQAIETQIPTGPEGHLMDLEGAWSVALHSTSESNGEGFGFTGRAVIPVSSDSNSLLHGYYFTPAYLHTLGHDEGRLNYGGFTGWQLGMGRGNLNFPDSIFRGYLQFTYRELRPNHDESSKIVRQNLGVLDQTEMKKSILISTGVSSTQSPLISQKRPWLNSEILLTVRYDYEEGDFFTHARFSLFYPTWVEAGVSAAWFKAFRKNDNPVFDEVSDDFIFGPRVRGKFWKHLGTDLALEWNAYRDFNGNTTIPAPRVQASVIYNW